MKNVLKDTQFNTYYFYEEAGLFLFDYKPSTETMSQAEYQTFIEELKDLTLEKKYLRPNQIRTFFFCIFPKLL